MKAKSCEVSDLEILVFFAMAASLDSRGTLKTEGSQEIIESLVTKGTGAFFIAFFD
jgi:hypothetical protein